MSDRENGRAEEFIENVIRLLRYATKPTREEIYQVTKIVVVSLLIVGIIGFVLKLVMQAIVGV